MKSRFTIMKVAYVVLILIFFQKEISACCNPTAPAPGMKPTAGFVVTPNGGPGFCDGLSLNFNACGDGAAASPYYWDFGDGNTATEPAISHLYIYADTGLYKVTLAVCNGVGCDTTFQYIRVYDWVNVDFSISDTIVCAGDSVYFQDISNGTNFKIVKWKWDFGDFTKTIEQNPVHVYDKAGVYTISFWSENEGGCGYWVYKTITVTEDILLSQFNVIESCPCNYFEIQNNSIGTVSWEWDLGDGTIMNTNNPGTHAYNNPGAYNISLKGTDANGCVSTTFKKITTCLTDTTLPVSKSNNRWYFSKSLGLNFNTASPSPLVGGQISTASEGVSTVSDPSTGNLLFYTDGSTVWDKNHVVMTNGTGLLGSWTTTQSSLIIPYPGNTDKYYLFTKASLDDNGSGLFYSIVDMTLRSGDGDVDILNKNVVLDPLNNSEAITGIQKKLATCNSNAEYWLMTVVDNNDSNFAVYKAYLITDAGIKSPVTYKSNLADHKFGNAVFSKDGTKFAMTRASGNDAGFELYNFNMSTGVLTNRQVIKTASTGTGYKTYNIAFSPSGDYLYATSYADRTVRQFDLNASNIELSQIVIFSTVFLFRYPLALYLGPDDKIYKTTYQRQYLGVVNDPDLPGLACNYVDEQIDLGAGGELYLGLQNLVPLILAPPLPKLDVSIGIKDTCPSLTAVFIDTACNFVPDSMTTTWTFGDGNQTTYPVYTFPRYDYSNPGTYNVEMRVEKECFLSDTAVATIIIDSVPKIFFIPPTLLCEADTTVLTALLTRIDSPYQVTWSGDWIDTGNTILATFPSSGVYNIIVQAEDSSSCLFSYLDIVTVKVSPVSYVSEDTTICNGDIITLSTGLTQGQSAGNVSYNWIPASNLDNANAGTVVANPNETISYIVEIKSNCGTDTSSVQVTVENCVVFIPSAFTPNGDGENDYFSIRGDGMNKVFIKIYDRWGNKVFETKDKNEGWDGTYNNKDVKSGVFVYVIDVTLLNDLPIQKKGNVTLVR